MTLVVGVTAALVTAVQDAGAAVAVDERDPASASEFAVFYRQSVVWTGCGDSAAGMECGQLVVPVDWTRPRGATTTLALARARGTGQGGPLVMNFGGPGGPSHIDRLSGAADMFHAAGLGSFDLVTWDPRGSGRSAPISCPPGATAAFQRVDGSPDTLSEAIRFDAAASRWASACRRASGPVFDHMDTDSTVRDLDVLRAVLGGRTLSYLGFSYGTMIGARYADRFPHRVGRMVLDSAVDPSLPGYQALGAGGAEAKDVALSDYLAGCAARPGCPLASLTPAQARGWLLRLVRDTDRHPLRAPSGATVTQAQLVDVLAGDVSSRENWPELDEELAGLRRGDATAVAGKARQEIVDVQNVATLCQDWPDHRDPWQVLRDAAATADTAPVFGAELTSGAPCPRWPAPVPVPPHPVHADGAAPILVVGVTHDTASPYRWSTALAAQLTDARRLTYDGTDHGAYPVNTCAREKENQFLVDGTLPPSGTVCRPD